MEHLNTVLSFAAAYINAGIKCMPVELARKKPRNTAWSTKFLDYKTFESIFVSGDGIGIVTGKESGIICIDIDNKPGRSAVGWYEANEDMLGSPLVEKTPSGGLHLYYKYPSNIDFLRSNKDVIYNGVEFFADGGKYVITAPSSKYIMHNDLRLSDIAFEGSEPPQWILDQVISYHQKRLENPVFEPAIAQVDIARCVDHISHMPPAIENQGGDLQTFKAACRCRDHGLTENQAFGVLLNHFNPRCVPPWTIKELLLKINNAYKYNSSPIGALVSSPETEFKEEEVLVVEQKKTSKLIITETLDFLGKKFPPKEHIIGPFVKQGLSMVYAPPGVGKTYFSMGLSYAIATGGEFLRWKCEKKQSVIYFDGELPAYLLQDRLRKLVENNPCDAFSLKLVTPDEQEGAMPDFSTKEGQAVALEAIGDSEFIVIDNLSTLCRTGKENEAESWIPVQNFLLKLRKLGKAVLIVHHSGKGEGASPRGTSKREDTLDLIISLSHPVDYKATDACSFQVKFRKSRHFRNKDDIEEFTARYVDFTWVVELLEKSNIDKILELASTGLKQKDIAESLKLDKGYVSRILKNNREKPEEEELPLDLF